MNRDELLTKLAMELGEWPIDVDHAVSILPDYVGMRFPCREITHPSISPFAEYQIGEQQWLHRRTELINEPDDADAPEWARWKAQDDQGFWVFYEHEPYARQLGWAPSVGKFMPASEGKIPAGHDWRTTLCEVNRDMSANEPVMSRNEPHGITGVKHRVGRQLNPIDSSPEDYQEAQAAMATGVCSNGSPCGQDDYCDDCPNAPHAQEARRLYAQLNDAVGAFKKMCNQMSEEIAAQPINANNILNAAAQHMKDRASAYDKPQGERSMAATVDAFSATTGIALTEEQGWHFMALLKLVRSQQGDLRLDSYEDGAAYFALAGEAAAKDRK